LVVKFFDEGGKINKYYLQNPRKNPVLVYLNGWYRGKNISDAISRALSDQ
jgi:hypothetical protein